MSKTETDSRAGEALSPAEEVAEAMTGFVTEIKGFQAEMQTKLQQTEERLTMLDRKQMNYARPQLSAAVEADTRRMPRPWRPICVQAMMTGCGALSLRARRWGRLSMRMADIWWIAQTSEIINSVLNTTASIRAIATVVNVEATSYDVLVDHGDVGTGWATETGTLSETSTPQIDRVTIPLHELSALPKASQRLLDDSAFDIETWLAGALRTSSHGRKRRPSSTGMARTSRAGS